MGQSLDLAVLWEGYSSKMGLIESSSFSRGEDSQIKCSARDLQKTSCSTQTHHAHLYAVSGLFPLLPTLPSQSCAREFLSCLYKWKLDSLRVYLHKGRGLAIFSYVFLVFPVQQQEVRRSQRPAINRRHFWRRSCLSSL